MVKVAKKLFFIQPCWLVCIRIFFLFLFFFWQLEIQDEQSAIIIIIIIIIIEIDDLHEKEFYLSRQLVQTKKKPKRISQNNRKIQIQILRYIQHTFTILLIYLSQVLLQCCYYVLNKNNNNNNRKLINIFILFFRFKISSIIRKKRTTRIHSRFKCV